MAQEQKSYSEFEPHVGDSFTLTTDSDDVEAELVEANQHADDDVQHSFSLLFEITSDTPLPQRIYPVSHAEMGAMQLFLVPVGQKGSSFQYEAVFSILKDESKRGSNS